MMSTYQRAQWEMRRFDADRRRREENRDNSTALHEAAHGLVGLLLGLTPRSITIEPDFDSEGVTTWAAASGAHGAFENIIVRVAGSEAEKMFGSADEGHENDLKHARMIAGWVCSNDDVDDVIDRARVAAGKILRANFIPLTKIALALLSERTLDRDQIEELIASSPWPTVDDGDDDEDADERSDDGMATLDEFLKAKAGGQRLVYYGAPTSIF